MKKIVVSIVIFLFAATLTSYAGIFTNNEESPGQYGALFGNSSNHSEGDSGYGGFFRASEADTPGGRPVGGGGIGQEAPIGDGLLLLPAYCVALIVVKIYNSKRKKNLNKK